mgnify:CR=1 FL=1
MGSTESVLTMVIDFFAVWAFFIVLIGLGRIVYSKYYARSSRYDFKAGSKDRRERVEYLQGKVSECDAILEGLHDQLARQLSLRSKLASSQEDLFEIQKRSPAHKEIDPGLHAALEDTYRMAMENKSFQHQTEALISKCQAERRRCVDELARLTEG